MLPFPEQHREITQQLLNGKFILQNDLLYNPIQTDREMYSDFFQRTYEYELVITSEYIYLKSTNEKDKSSRDFLIFLSLHCRELDKYGKDFKEEVDSESFLVEDISNFLTESSKKKEIIENTSMVNNKGELDLINFLNEWQRRNVIQYVGNNKTKFRYTKAMGMFFDFAVVLANKQLKGETNDLQTTVIGESI